MLKISEQQTMLETALKAWAEPRSGKVVSLHNERHLWEALCEIPNPKDTSPRVIILFRSEEPRGSVGERDLLCRCDRVWWVIVVRAHGFIQPMSGGAFVPFTDSLEEVRDLLRCILNLSDEEQVPSLDYRRTFPLPSVMPQNMANVFNDATVIEFSTANDIAAILDQAPGSQ